MAVAASVPCLRHFAGDESGLVLLFAAEDAIEAKLGHRVTGRQLPAYRNHLRKVAKECRRLVVGRGLPTGSDMIGAVGVPKPFARRWTQNATPVGGYSCLLAPNAPISSW